MMTGPSLLGYILILLNYQGIISGLVNYEKDVDQIIWVKAGDQLKSLSCPHANNVMFNWKIKEYLEYELISNPKFVFSPDNTMLTISQPIAMEDAGIYECSAVGGYKSLKKRYLVKVRYPNSRLFCSQNLCFSDPAMLNSQQTPISFTEGQFLELDCSAFSPTSEPVSYSWSFNQRVIDSGHSSSLVLDPVSSENEGVFTCDLKDKADGRLSYSFRLVGKKFINKDPVIITKLENMILSSNMSVKITAEVECGCSMPNIQWLKRIEPGETHNNAITIPNARKAEKNEVYRLLEQTNHADSPIKVDRPSLEAFTGQLESREVKTFKSNLKLVGPLLQNVHSGKYVLLTVDPKAQAPRVQYETFEVSISKENDPEEVYTVYYFLVPFVVLFGLFALFIYCILHRNKRNKGVSSIGSHEHWISGGMLQADAHYLKTQNSTSTPCTFQTSLLSPYNLLKSTKKHQPSTTTDHTNVPYFTYSNNNSNSSSELPYKYQMASGSQYTQQKLSPHQTPNQSMIYTKTLSTELPYDQQYAAVSTIDTLSSHNTNPYSIPCYENDSVIREDSANQNNPFINTSKNNNNYQNNFYMN